jgi:hypothetical protein
MVMPKRRSRKVTVFMREDLYAKVHRRAQEDAISESATVCQLIARGLAAERPRSPQDTRTPEATA